MEFKILIIDANTKVSERLSELITDNINVTHVFAASTYEMAVGIFEEYNPEMILLDMELPGNNAIRLLKYFNQSIHSSIVVALTIYPDTNNKRRCVKYGADFFYDKYYDFEKIPGIIKQQFVKNQS